MTWSFAVYVCLMVVFVAIYFVAGRRSRHVDASTERVASVALPKIGEIADKQHTLRFGRPPTGTEDRTKSSSWYPPTKSSGDKP
jgi:hypothetical protein